MSKYQFGSVVIKYILTLKVITP